jgi:kynurenine formamidase
VSGHRTVIDLSQDLEPGTPLWPGSTPIAVDQVAAIERDGYFARDLRTPEHAGTHLDAPAHFDPAGAAVPAIDPERLVVPCSVLDASEAAAADPDTAIGAGEIEDFEHASGAVVPGSALLLRTGWDRKLGTDAYHGTDEKGGLHFPGFAPSAADFLLARGVVGIGIDTLSVDRGCDPDFPVHRITLPAGLWHLEGLVGLERLPAHGATLVVGALPIAGGSGAPARVLALVES